MQRDNSLDVLKGLACLLMMIAHVPFIMKDSEFFNQVYFVGHLAPVIFFAVSGATMMYQLKGRSFQGIVISYAVLFLAGYSYNGMLNPAFYKNFQVEIVQIVAAGSVVVAFLETRFSPSNWMYLLIGIGIFLLKLFFDEWAPDFDGAKLIMPRSDYIHWYELLAKGSPVIFPGFPLLPWLFLFPMGVAAYRQRNALNLAIAALILVVCLVIDRAGLNVDWLEKWDMSLGYFLVSCGGMFFAFFVFRALSSRFQNTKNPIIFIGRNSLLFLYVHIPMILLGGLLSFKNQYVWWLNTIWMTYLVMWILTTKVKDAQFLKSERGWFILIGIILLSPLLGFVNEVLFIPVYFIEVVSGILFARNYKSLGSLPYLARMKA